MRTAEIGRAERAAEKILSELKLDTLPISPFKIAAAKGIHVEPKVSSEPGVSGFLMRIGDSFGICYASHIKNEGFIHFSIAHEIGHYSLEGHVDAFFSNGNSIHASRSGFVSDNEYERQADHFAAALLMPETLFKKAIQTVGFGFPAIEALKNLCKTSITSTAIRYATFTSDPVAVIVSKGKNIDYCFISDALMQIRGVKRVPKNTPLPLNGGTMQFNSNQDQINGGTKVEEASFLNDWFDGAPAIRMKEDIVGLGSYGKTLTVLFTDESIDDEEEIED